MPQRSTCLGSIEPDLSAGDFAKERPDKRGSL
jgi:hypothetical protein